MSQLFPPRASKVKIENFTPSGYTPLPIGNESTDKVSAHLNGLDSKNATQNTSITDVESKNTTQDSRLTSVESKNTTQDTRLTTNESKNTTQDTRLTAVESVNTTQTNLLDSKVGLYGDETINGLKTFVTPIRLSSLNTGDNIITTDTDGDMQESGAQIVAAPAGGSGMTFANYASAPSTPPTGFFWIEDIDANTKKVAFYDGTDTFSVELSKE